MLSQSSKAILLISIIFLSHSVLFSPAFAKDRIALIIGNSLYDPATPLRNPQNDIELVQSSLQKAGFRTFMGKDLTAHKTGNLIDRFIKTAKRLNNPTVLFYFAGHGVQLNGINYLLPTDAPVESPSLLKKASLNASKLLKKLEQTSPRIVLMILDACRDDPFENATRSIKRGLSNIKIQASSKLKSKVIAFSTAPGKVAADGKAGTSPYASAFAESILIPGMTIEDVFRRTRRLVHQRTNGKQESWENSSLYEKFVFIPKNTKILVSQSETEIWEFAAMVNTAESYRRYLEKFPQGIFQKIALTKIEAINKDFSYQRKAERFPILEAKMDDFERCSDSYTGKTDRMNLHLKKLEQQIVYIHFELPYETIICDGKKPGIKFIKGKEKDCEVFFMSGLEDGFDSSLVECINPHTTSITPGVIKILKEHGDCNLPWLIAHGFSQTYILCFTVLKQYMLKQ